MADSKYKTLVEQGIISQNQACVLEELGKIDNTSFEYKGLAPPDTIGHIFKDNSGRTAGTLPPKMGDTVDVITPDGKGTYHKDVVDPDRKFLKFLDGKDGSAFETRHYDGTTGQFGGNIHATIDNSEAEPSGKKDVLGSTSRDPTARENKIHEKTRECFNPKPPIS